MDGYAYVFVCKRFEIERIFPLNFDRKNVELKCSKSRRKQCNGFSMRQVKWLKKS